MMKKLFLAACMLLMTMGASAQVAKMLGDWHTVDDKTGEQRSIVHIYKAKDGLYYGRIQEMLVGGHDVICPACVGEDKGKKLEGLIIVRGMKEVDGELQGGRVLDPESGKFYYGKIFLKDGKLVLRGSIDKAGFLGRSQTWIR